MSYTCRHLNICLSSLIFIPHALFHPSFATSIIPFPLIPCPVSSDTHTHTFTVWLSTFSPPTPKIIPLSPAVAVITVCSTHEVPAVTKQAVNSLISHPLLPPSFLSSALCFCLLLPSLTGVVLIQFCLFVSFTIFFFLSLLSIVSPFFCSLLLLILTANCLLIALTFSDYACLFDSSSPSVHPSLPISVSSLLV